MPQGSLDAAILLISLWFCRWRSWPWVDPERDTHTSNGTYRITLLHLPLDSPDLTALGMWRSWLCYRSRPTKITWLWIKKDHRENLLPAVVLVVFKHKWWCKNSPVERMLLLQKSLMLVLRDVSYAPIEQTRFRQEIVSFTTCFAITRTPTTPYCVSSMLTMSRTARGSCGGHAPRPRDVANTVLLEYLMKRVPGPFVKYWSHKRSSVSWNGQQVPELEARAI